MASRLALKYGLVAEEDRLSNSSDALIVTEPTTGSKARTKGSLYLIVCSRGIGGKTRDACRLVADTIRREYYYDESAGIAIVLEKAIRAANRRLRHAREGNGLAAYSVGIALAVVRGNELYVATCGDANAYLIRSARLLMPEYKTGVGLPAADNLHVGVWRGEFAVGDSLVISSRNLVEIVGTEELKNAVVTLHPQSAVEHLHHLFVAAGGEGSDAVLAIEATEVSLARVEPRLVPVTPAEPLAGAPEKSPIPLADHVAGFAGAVRERAGATRSGIGDRISGAVGRVLDLMPRRRAGYRRIRTAPTPSQQRDTQRRAVFALAAFIIVVAVLGIGVWYLGPFRAETPIDNLGEGQAALTAASDKADQALDSDLMTSDPTAAQELLEDAWDDLQRAEGHVNQQAFDRVESRVVAGLDQVYSAYRVVGAPVYTAPPGTEITGLVLGPDQAAYAIVGPAVVRIDPVTGASTTIIQSGEGSGQGIGQPRLLARGGPDLLVIDVRGGLWRWRPSGTLGQVRIAGEQVWGEGVVDVETFLINPDQGLYRLYVPYPPSAQVLRYEPTADGSGFSAPAPYFVGESEDVAAFKQLLIDGDLYAVTEPAVIRYFNGRRTGFSLDDPPDDANIRVGHQYSLLAATGTRGIGRMFVWDSKWSRVVAWDKAEGAYLEQYLAAEGAPPLSDVRGMYVMDRGEVQPPILFWARPEGVYQTVLTRPAQPVATPSGTGSPRASPGGSPSVAPQTPTPRVTATPGESVGPQSPTPAPETPAPTERPRRTPRAGAPSPTP